MKSKKYIKVLLLAFIVNIINPDNFAYANELEQQIFEDVAPENSIENLKNYDIASGKEIFEYLISSQSNAEEFIFGKEYLQRLELAKEIAILRKIDSDDSLKILEQSTSILNSDDLFKIKEQSSKLHGLYKDFANKKGLILEDLSQEEIKDLEEKTKNYLNYGLLFDFAKKNDFDLFAKAILNSKTYFMAADKEKALYEEIIQELSLNKSTDEKENEENYKILADFVKIEDKKTFLENLKKEKQNKESLANNPQRVKILEIEDKNVESTDIEGLSLFSSNEIQTENSAFLNNVKTKDLYNNLSDGQKNELDLLDTDKNGMISDSELDNSTNYSSNLDENSWIYPFTEKSLNQNHQETVALESNQPTSDNQNNESSQSQVATNNPPQTVTIDKSNKAPQLNKDKSEANKKENEKSTNENSNNVSAAKIVKTGISSVWIFSLILVLAIGAYYLLYRNKKNK